MDNKIKHLEMIENVIQRMASNSFQLKGWAVTLVTILGGLSAAGSDKRFILVSFIPCLAFWFLDSYYLQLERKFRCLYKKVVTLSEDQIDFCMDMKNIQYSAEDAKRTCYCKCLFSASECGFYLPICAAIVLLAFFLKVI